MASFGVHSEVGKLRTVDRPPARAQPEAADPRQPRRAAVRRRPVGRAGAVGARPVRQPGCASAASRCCTCRICSARRSRRARMPASGSSRSSPPKQSSARAWSRTSAPPCTQLPPDALARHLIGGLTVGESGLDLGKLAKTSLIGAAIDDESLFVLPPLPNTLFMRDSSCWIYGGVSINPMYWPARRREAYNMAAIYRAHPRFQDAGLRVLVSGARRGREVQGRGLRPGLAGGWRRRDHRQGDGRHRHVRAHDRTDDRAHRQGPLCQGRRGAGHRRGHDQGPRPHAPRHGVHPARPRQGDSLSEGRRGDPLDQSAAGQEAGHPRRPAGQGLHLGRHGRARASRSSTSSRPAATPTSRRASSGTTATTSSPSNPAWSSPTSATRSRSRRCGRRASRSSRSRASSWARAAGVGTA